MFGISPAHRWSIRQTIAAAVLTLATLPLGAAQAATPKGVIEFGADAFSPSAGWERVAGQSDGRYRGASIRSFRPGARATLDFNGTAVRLFGVIGLNGGLGIVKIDGQVADVMTFFGSHKVVHYEVFKSPALRRGAHRLTIEVIRSSRDLKAKSGYVNIDEADVTT